MSKLPFFFVFAPERYGKGLKSTGFRETFNGWNSVAGFAGTVYSAALNSEYIASIGTEINTLKNDMNSAAGTARGIAQEAGFAAEKWVAGTFNIDSAAKESNYKANVENSYDFASADISTNYGEKASLKYYRTGSASANAQAIALIEKYRKYTASSKNPKTLQEYMDSLGYDYQNQNELMASIYEGQTRIIPSDQMEEATRYLKGRKDKLSVITGKAAAARTQAYHETMNNLRDRLMAPDGTQSKPATYEEMQAIAELSQSGKFNPEDFGISVSQVITPKYIVKQAIGTGTDAGVLKTVLTVGPDLVSILTDEVKSNKIALKSLKESGIEGAIAMSSGFVEGSISRIVVSLCNAGTLGESLKGVSPDVIGVLVFFTIEAMISGYYLATGEITAEEYGCLMADKILITGLAVPTSALLMAILPATKIVMLLGCMAGSIVAGVGYTIGKEAVLKFIDGGGFEAIILNDAGDNMDLISDIDTKISKLKLSEHLSNLKQFTVTTLDTGIIKIKGVLN